MKNLVILGAGSAGTIMANHLCRSLSMKEWRVSVIEQHRTHYYQPGFLFMPFGIYGDTESRKRGSRFIPRKARLIQARAEVIDHEKNRVVLADGGSVPYDILIIATGARIVPGETEGFESDEWHRSIHDFYTFEGARILRKHLAEFEGGRLAVHITEMPIKCPVAPLEFAFLADWYFTKRGIRDRVDISFVTPLSSAFTKPTAAKTLGDLLDRKKITTVPDFAVERVDADKKKLVCYDERTVDYDLLVTVPTNMGDEMLERSGLGDDLNFVPTDRNTLQSKARSNIFVLGDATDLPSSKAGSVAHFEAEVLSGNIHRYIGGEDLEKGFDGHANCFVESGFGKAILIDFNYDVEPVTGTFPFPVVGPMRLLTESRLNHWAKLAFRHLYWNVVLRALPTPGISAQMSLSGKNIESKAS